MVRVDIGSSKCLLGGGKGLVGMGMNGGIFGNWGWRSGGVVEECVFEASSCTGLV